MLRFALKKSLVSGPLKLIPRGLNTLAQTAPKPSINAADFAASLQNLKLESTVKETAPVEEVEATSENSSDDLSSIGFNQTLTAEQRYAMKQDPFVNLVVNLVMRDGKKALAESIVGKALYFIRLWTHSGPEEVLRNAVDKAAPLMSTNSLKMGSKNTLIPVALPQRKRHRIAINWILTAAEKRKDSNFARKLANELISVINGDSSVLLKKNEMHKLVLANRTNAITYR